MVDPETWNVCVAVLTSVGHKEVAARIEKQKAARAAEFLSAFGCTRAEVHAAPMKVRNAYRTQRHNAKNRGIGWEFTFPEWLAVWRSSGKFDQRGTGQGYCMARIFDSGPYRADNVYICTVGQNFSDSYLWKPYEARRKRA